MQMLIVTFALTMTVVLKLFVATPLETFAGLATHQQ